MARMLLCNEILSGASQTISGKWGCVYAVPNIQENVGFELCISGIYEEETVRFINSRLKEGGVFLDVGANIGAISIPVCKQRQDIDVVCLEAAPWIFEYLTRNIQVNGLRNVLTINKAIADVNGAEIDFFSPKGKFGKGSMAPVFTQEAVKVETVTLDQLAVMNGAKPIDFVKIDVEGFEALAFRGGNVLLADMNSPEILFEFVDWAEELAGEKPGNAQLQLLKFGYRLYCLENGNIGSQVQNPLTTGSHMIFATKRVVV